ncbi:MAG: serine/threonine protein kinase [Thermoactinospora sp.]|nr:serine/threonine protein kinase [Thermoactinospora sp.]
MSDGQMPEQVLSGRYRLDEVIDRTGTSEVWRGHDLQADWAVAVKLLEEGGDAVTRGRFARRAQALATVLHPNVVTVLDVGDRFVVMEYLPGKGPAGPSPSDEVRTVLAQVASGLEAAHRSGIVHGNLSPADIRRAGSGVLKVTGFGLLGDGLPVPVVPVTPYRAPEQLDGETGKPADVYALGCVAYELLTGQPPFEGDDLETQHRTAKPERLSGVPEELGTLVQSCLAKDPAARPTVSAVRQALAGPLGAPREPVAAAASQPMYGTAVLVQPLGDETALFEQRHEDLDRPDRRMLVQLGIALAIIVAAVAAFAFWPRGSENPDPVVQATPSTVTEEPTPEPTPTETPTPSESQAPPSTVGPVQTLGPQPVGDTYELRTDVPPPGGWDTWLLRFHEAVEDEEDARAIEPGVAQRAHRAIDAAARRIREGRIDRGIRDLQKVARELGEARDRGDVRGDGSLNEFLTKFALWP